MHVVSVRLWSFLKGGSKLEKPTYSKDNTVFVNRLNDEVIKVGHDLRK